MATKKETSNGHKRPPIVGRDIPANNAALSYISCTECIKELSHAAIGILDYASITVAFTSLGIQVWCTRHGVNVIHVDFEGMKHPANTQAK